MIYVAITEAIIIVIAGITIRRMSVNWSNDMRRATRLSTLLSKQCDATSRRLLSLRSNCFLTDEKGHRRRYADCSEAVRDKAETN